MFDFHEKRKIRSIVYSKLSIGLLLLFAGFLAVSAHERYVVEREMAEKLNDRKEELRLMEQRAQALRAKVEHLENDRGIEEELRGRFDVAKEGEQVVIIIDDPTKKELKQGVVNTSTALENSVESEQSLWEMFKFW